MSEKDYMNMVDPWLRIRVEHLKELVDAASLPDFETQATEIDKLWKALHDYEEMHRTRLESKRRPELERLTVDELGEMHMELSSGRWPVRKAELVSALLEMEWRSGAIWKAYRDARHSYTRFDNWREELKRLPVRLQELEEEATSIAKNLSATTSVEAISNMKRYGMRSMVAFYQAETATAARLLYQEGGYFPAVMELINRARQMLYYTASSRLEASVDGASEVAKLLAARELLTLSARYLPAEVRPYFPSR
ncbi:hypothetical protein [Streptomyces sp. H27-C3]|uniref:hypothetical protein n=1 Tax=Streptomyces sp. H27-C3 TaxID=3046305 RepID=UPI0024BB44AD|nr:hypothetical protein [Streptomyces sp. H27-C3]MDJ0463075.1 hypothetical protein [Streptomyces sp. H27-C3]